MHLIHSKSGWETVDPSQLSSGSREKTINKGNDIYENLLSSRSASSEENLDASEVVLLGELLRTRYEVPSVLYPW